MSITDPASQDPTLQDPSKATNQAAEEAVNSEEESSTEQTSTQTSSSKKKKKKPKKKKNKNANQAGGLPSDPTIPVSRLDPLLSIPSGIKSHVFSQTKGRGLVATRDFKEGETLFVEESYVNTCPSSAIRDCLDGKICSHCFLPTNGTLVVDCKKGSCKSSFCNRM